MEDQEFQQLLIDREHLARLWGIQKSNRNLETFRQKWADYLKLRGHTIEEWEAALKARRLSV